MTRSSARHVSIERHMCTLENRARLVWKSLSPHGWGTLPYASEGQEVWVPFCYFLENKSNICSKFIEFPKIIITQFNMKIKVVGCDNDSEFICLALQEFEKKRIIYGNSMSYFHEQSGQIERNNSKIVESVRSMLHRILLPQNLWAEAVNSAIHVVNKTESTLNGEIKPYETWQRKKPNIEHLLPFGQEGYHHSPSGQRHPFPSWTKTQVQ